jgi:hypothetical protein
MLNQAKPYPLGFAVLIVLRSAGLLLSQSTGWSDESLESVEIENEEVRVLRQKLGPGAKSPMHAYAQRLVIPITPVHIKVTLSTGESEEQKRPVGSATWIEANEQSTQNLSSSTYEAFVIEVKGAVARPVTPFSPSPDPSHEMVVLENSRTQVLRAHIPPMAQSRLHPHPNRIVIPLNEQRSRSTTDQGKTDERNRQRGQVFWAAANVHKTENLRNFPIDTVIVDLTPSK